jgi:hypothetical protein
LQNKQDTYRTQEGNVHGKHGHTFGLYPLLQRKSRVFLLAAESRQRI